MTRTNTDGHGQVQRCGRPARPRVSLFVRVLLLIWAVACLAAVTGKAIAELDKEWVAWVKTLRFPEP